MYNIVRGQVVAPDWDPPKVIDPNERMNEVLERQRKLLEEQAIAHREHLIREYLFSLEADEEGKPVIPKDEEGNYILPFDEEGNQLLYVTSDGFLSEEEEEIVEEEEEPAQEELPPPEPEVPAPPPEPPIDREAIMAEINAEADSIRAQANDEAAQILEQARQEAERLKEEARNAGHEEGFAGGHAEGLSKASEECEARFAQQSAELEAKVNQQSQQLAQEYTAKMEALAKDQESLEEQMANVFCDIIDKVFHIEFSDKKEIILHLVDNVISNTSSSKEYLIRINDANYDLIYENRQSIIDKIGSGVVLDIVKDPLLGVEECQIETDGGVYDCGMDVQLANLLKDLRALSLV